MEIDYYISKEKSLSLNGSDNEARRLNAKWILLTDNSIANKCCTPLFELASRSDSNECGKNIKIFVCGRPSLLNRFNEINKVSLD